MVFEQVLESPEIKKHSLFVFILGIFYVIVGYVVSIYFFPTSVSIAMLFTSSLLLVPSIATILNTEEKLESKEGIKHFYHNHKDIFRIYFWLFKGIFVAFLILGVVSQTPVFEYQLNFLQARGDLSTEVLNEFSKTDYVPSLNHVASLITQNLLVIIIAFILSVFYGAGALFLIVLNASVFAAFISYVIREIGKVVQMISIFLIHLVPELTGFLAAAIAGGVVSRALYREKLGSKEFQNVMKDALILLLIAVGLIIISAFLEVYVSANLVKLIL